jgi:hypothetical protein
MSRRPNPLAATLKLIAALVVLPAVVATQPRESADTAPFRHWLGVEYHIERRLNEASREYARTLTLDPPRDVTPEQHALVRRFAPRLYTVDNEPFVLEDVAAILHPTRRVIAWHFFWDDDIDFPDDNDPTDHEVMWVQYSEDGRALEAIWTYFHGQIIVGGAAALDDARQQGMRPRVDVQWGKHGSMLAGWPQLTPAIAAEDNNAAAWRRLSTEGARQKSHPVARRLGWPERFTGSEAAFLRFSRLIDPLPMLEKSKMMQVTRWNSATISQRFLPYNFRPKTEWPPEPGRAAAPTSAGVSALAAFQLPAKTTFDRAMPRYPNLWLHLDTSLAESYEAAVRLLTGGLDTLMGLQEAYGPFSNPEGCDFEATREHLQPWQRPGQRPLQHSHAFHIRYYHSALSARGLERVRVTTAAGVRELYRVAASAHYEVEHTNPNHADVETCAICGRTGAYADRTGNLVEAVHDPLGLELALHGTIRGEPVALRDNGSPPRRAAAGFGSQFSVQYVDYPSEQPDQNTARIGVIVVSPPDGR